MPRLITACLSTLALLAPAAPAWAQNPLTGEGENFELVANLPIDPGSEGLAASDIEMHGDYAFIGSYSQGLVIADISDPLNPKRAATFHCGGGSQYDVQLSNDGNLVVLSTDSTGAACLEPNQSGSIIIDVTDKSSPQKIGFIPIQVGTHTHTLDDRTLYVNNYPTSYSKLEVFDLTNPYAPRKAGELKFGGEDGVHDSFVDHRPDGRSLLYAASIGYTDVIDISDPAKPALLQRIQDGSVSISHQAEPSHDRDTLVVTDEFLGGQPSPYCGGLPIQLGQEAAVPEAGDPTNLGALHFYKLGADGTIAENGTGEGKIGTWNLPATLNPTGGCTVHVFWQAPSEERLVTAWYGRGIHAIDYSDPTDVKHLGYFIPSNADTWSAKPHRGYIFTGDINRGMDVLRYTGEDGARWPATAGPQEDQRRAYRMRPGATPAGSDPAPAPQPAAEPAGGVAGERAASRPRLVGGARKTLRLRIPGRGRRLRTLTATFTGARGAVVAKLRFRGRAGTMRRLRITVAGVPGRYR